MDKHNLITLKEWCIKQGKSAAYGRKLIDRDRLPQAFKLGREWLIDADAPIPADRRYKASI